MFDRERFTESCLEALKEKAPHQAVLELVRRTVASPAEVMADLGVPVKAGNQVLYRSDELTILNVIWAPRMAIYPHNHNTWAVIGVYGGQEDNHFFRRRTVGEGLEEVNGRTLVEHDGVSLGPDVIHSVVNPRMQYTGALHVYGGDFFAIPRSEWHTPEDPEAPYDVERAMSVAAQAEEAYQRMLREGQTG